jgi:hypothetical protein
MQKLGMLSHNIMLAKPSAPSQTCLDDAKPEIQKNPRNPAQQTKRLTKNRNTHTRQALPKQAAQHADNKFRRVV